MWARNLRLYTYKRENPMPIGRRNPSARRYLNEVGSRAGDSRAQMDRVRGASMPRPLSYEGLDKMRIKFLG